MVKAPRAGAVKTRLVPPLSADGAASLAACFARDTVATARCAARHVIVAYAPRDGRATLEPLLDADDLLWHEQRGAELGARLEDAIAQAFSLGFGPVVAVGTDSPTLPPSFVESAAASLSEGVSDVALGPTDDGGYYLVGVRRPASDLFRKVEWSTPRAYRQTADNAARLRLRTFELPKWYDVDTPADLLRLRDELLASESARERAPATFEWLTAHSSTLPASP